MADQKRWFKVWTSILSDPHFQALKMQDRGRWVTLGALTAQQGSKGTFRSPIKFLSKALQLSADKVLEKCQKLPNIFVKNDNGEITVTFKNWNKYQLDSTGYARLRRYRKRKIRNGKKSVTVTVKDKDKDKDKDKEKEIYKEKADAFREDEKTIFTFWLWNMEKDPSKTQLTDERKQKIKARLKRFPMEDILWAICGCGASAFHQGQNDEKKKYDDLTLICRSDSKLEQFQGYISREKAMNYIEQWRKESDKTNENPQ